MGCRGSLGPQVRPKAVRRSPTERRVQTPMGSVLKRVRKNSQWAHSRPVTSSIQHNCDGVHRYITIGRYHRNLANAEQYVLNLFRSLDPTATVPMVHDRVFRDANGQKAFEVSFRAAVQDARERGTAENLWSYLNGNDPYFVFTIGSSMDGEGLTLEIGFAGQKLKLEAPMRQGSVELELTEDILEHRRQASLHSLKGHDGFGLTSMHFRGYLLSSCALVEAFLNRCVLLEVMRRPNSPALAELQNPCRIERKFQLWLDEFAGEPLTSINSGTEWDHYQELRRLRNSLMHATHSMLGIGLKDTARQLNLVRQGVGGLINLLRRTQSLPPVPFAERLETAPECQFVSEVSK